MRPLRMPEPPSSTEHMLGQFLSGPVDDDFTDDSSTSSRTSAPSKVTAVDGACHRQHSPTIVSRRPTTSERPSPPGDVRLSVVVPAYERAGPDRSSIWLIRARARRRSTAGSRSWSSTTARPTAPPSRPGRRRRSVVVVHDHEPGQGRGGAHRHAAPPPAGRSRSPTPTSPTRRHSCVRCSTGRGGLGRRGRQPGARRHRDGRAPSLVRAVGGRVINVAHSPGPARAVPRHAVRAQGVPLRRGAVHLRPDAHRRLRLRRRGVRPRRAQRAVADRGTGDRLEHVTLDGARVLGTACGSSATCCASGSWARGRRVRRNRRHAGRSDGRSSVGPRCLPRRSLQGLRHPGLVPDQLDADDVPRHRRRVRPLRRARRARARRARHATLRRRAVRRVRRRRASQGVDVVDLGWRRPTSCTSRRARSTRRARCSPRRTTPPSTTASSSAWPARSRSARTRACSRSRRWPSAESTPAATEGTAHAGRSARRLRRPRALVRRRRRPDAAQGRRRHRQRHGRPRRARRVRTAAVRPRDHVRRARRHVPEPSGRPDPAREPARPRGPGDGSERPTSASPSTATPTACSSSTTRACPCRARPRRRSWRRRCSASSRARRSSTTASARRRCPRSSARTAARRSAPASATASSRQVMAETGAAFGGEHSAHYYFRDNYRADSGSSPRWSCSSSCAWPACRCPSCASRSSATRSRARSTPRSPTRRR